MTIGASAATSSGYQNTQGSSTTKLNFDPQVLQSLLDSLNGLKTAQTDTTYDKTGAIRDATSASTTAMSTILKQLLPNVNSAFKATGGFNSTTNAEMTGAAAAQAQAVGAQTILDTIKQYANIRQGNISAATGAVSAASNAVSNTTGQTTNSTQATQSSQTDAKAGLSVSVICTRLYNDGILTNREWVADMRFSASLPAHVYQGYIWWAMPFVGLMGRNRVAYAIGRFIGVGYSRYCAGNRGIHARVVYHTLKPICSILGHIRGACTTATTYCEV